MKPRVEIFSQGEEIITGQIVDTNSAWLSDQVNAMGFRVTRHSAVGDDVGLLKALLLEIAERVDCCLCSGGLGPTVDDLTAQAVSEAFDVPLKRDEIALAQIQAWFNQRGRIMVDSNLKQAFLPQGCMRLDNFWGTAPGFALKFKQCWFYFMPGVPSEMKKMFTHGVRPHLAEQFELSADKLVIMRTVGLGESDIQQRMQQWQCPDKVRLGFRTTGDDIEVKLVFPAGFPETLRRQTVSSLSECLGDIVYRVETPDNSLTLAELVTEKLKQRHCHLRLIETVSYGAIAARFAGAAIGVNAQVMADLSEVEGQTLQAKAHHLAAQQPPQDGELLLLQLYDHASQNLLTFLTHRSRQYMDEKKLAGSARQQQHRATIVALDSIRKFL